MANQNGATIDGAASRLNALLTPEPEGQPEQDAEPAPEPEETPETPPEVEESEDQPETEVELFTVKVNGEDQEVTLEDLRKGYMLESDYRKKTTDLAEQRKSLETKGSEVDQQLESAKLLLEMDVQRLESAEMQQLKEDDPETYLKEFEKVNQRITDFNALSEQRSQELQTKQNDLVQAERDALSAALMWDADEEAAEKDAKLIQDGIASVGISQEEFSSMLNHKIMLLARKAALYDSIDRTDLESKKVRTPPKVQQPGTPADKADKADKKISDLKGKLRKTGKPQDAAAIIREMMR